MAHMGWLVGLVLLLLAAGCQTPPQPKGFELRFLPETGTVTAQEKNAFDIHPRECLKNFSRKSLRGMQSPSVNTR